VDGIIAQKYIFVKGFYKKVKKNLFKMKQGVV